MNAKAIVLTLGAILFASASALAAQPHGRDSVYAKPGISAPSFAKEPAVAGNGRGSVYATMLPSPTPRSKVVLSMPFKPGRA